MPRHYLQALSPTVLACLLLSGCPGPRGPRVADIQHRHPQIEVPARITRATAPRVLERYQDLPILHPAREPLRSALLAHLVRVAETELAAGRPAQALDLFQKALDLYTAPEVFQKPRKQPALARLAASMRRTYAPRGNAEAVTLALAVEMSLGEDRTELKGLYQVMAGWLDDTSVLVEGAAGRGSLAIQVLEQCAERWPSSFVVEELSRRYMERFALLDRESRRHEAVKAKGSFPRLFLTGYLLVRLHLRVNEPVLALRRLQAMPKKFPQDEVLEKLLSRILSRDTKISEYINIYRFFSQEDSIGINLCQEGLRRFPSSAALHHCVGQMAAKEARPLLAQTRLEEAVNLAPDEIQYATSLAQLYQNRLFYLVGEERSQEALALLPRVESFYRRAEGRLRQSLEPGLGRAYQAVGRALFDEGRVDEAASFLRKARTHEPLMEAAALLATIQMNKGDTTGALAFISSVEQDRTFKAMNDLARHYWSGRLAMLRGKALDRGGPSTERQTAWQTAVVLWQAWLTQELEPEAEAEAGIYLATARFRLGQTSEAMDALDAAMEAEPERGETYLDGVALLSAQGHLPEALDAYYRALGRKTVSEYYKCYSSLWVLGLLQRAGLPPDPLAMEFLSGLRADYWPARLARLMLGRSRFEDVLAAARTTGERSEAYFYQGVLLEKKGQSEQARQFWKKVVDTDMMGFYEYEMALQYLREGLRPVQTQPVERGPSPVEAQP